MTRIVYCNGAYLDYAKARVHAEDRGFQFGDAVYEVCEVMCGRLVDETRHMDRLERSLGELQMGNPMSRGAWGHVMREIVRRNRVTDGLLYLQVSRGSSPRDFFFPPEGTPQTVVVLARSTVKARGSDAATAPQGITIKTVPDIRWKRCDIKSVMLLPASLAKEAARAEGAQDAWFVGADGFITEGGSSNAWIVDQDGVLVTTPISNALLRGVTRTTLLDVLKREDVALQERTFTVEEALAAREAFITSATNILTPVTAIDGQPVGNGHPGLLTLKLQGLFHGSAEIAAA